MLALPLVAVTRLVVGAGGEFATLRAALAAARAGDTIELGAGVYREGPIVIDRPVTIIGLGRPVLEGTGDHSLLRVIADDVALEASCSATCCRAGWRIARPSGWRASGAAGWSTTR
jgi:nitrous oxidase accessory protein